MTDYVKQKNGGFSDIQIKNHVFDNLRNILPVCVQTNIGMTINARNLEYAIVKMITHPLKELNQIGEKLKPVITEN